MRIIKKSFACNLFFTTWVLAFGVSPRVECSDDVIKRSNVDCKVAQLMIQSLGQDLTPPMGSWITFWCLVQLSRCNVCWWRERSSVSWWIHFQATMMITCLKIGRLPPQNRNLYAFQVKHDTIVYTVLLCWQSVRSNRQCLRGCWNSPELSSTKSQSWIFVVQQTSQLPFWISRAEYGWMSCF